MVVTINLNGKDITEDVSPSVMLVDFLRAHNEKSVKHSCESSSCGSCTVLLEDKPILSCSYPVVRANHKKITTLEGLEEKALEIGKCVEQFGAIQCGFCNPGIILCVIALLRENPNPDENDIRKYLSGNLCRCSGYDGWVKGIEAYVKGGNA